jgi:hypothetical protein
MIVLFRLALVCILLYNYVCEYEVMFIPQKNSYSIGHKIVMYILVQFANGKGPDGLVRLSKSLDTI